ncbi:1-deoxy-D-xylulose-5-phosphate synthase [[Mycoplasma] testudinis]|uniref:1-deoxy-D-xylulose-5-phosphate synthase n=1 Tax=[Mycoplasma] testudinis TaxID=33924 RepID=UPI0006964E60|nr:1-deoxy-D-xylulose-5-phosphate synthase [[Mycoplasma] testudinis]
MENKNDLSNLIGKYPLLNQIDSYADFKKIPSSQLTQLATEVRNFIIELAKNKSIHLGSNLGVVELSIVLCRVFDLDKNIVFYDTGHQAYVHKILTGRAKQMHTIRDTNGLSGMQDMNESKYDFYSGGHCGNSLSVAQGFCEADGSENALISNKWKKALFQLLEHEINPSKIKKITKFQNKFKVKKKYIVPVIGDSSISNGIALEALNDLSFRKTQPIVILNDNGMSISKSVGSLAKAVSKIRVNKLVTFIEKILYKILWNTELGKKIYRFMYKIFHGVGKRVAGANIFSSLGFQYIGPINGHNIKALNNALEKAKWYQQFQPVIVHIKTIKGFGLDNAIKDTIGMLHNSIVENDTTKLTGEHLSNYLNLLMAQNKSIRVINPAMTLNSGFLQFSLDHPGYYFDVGISEEHALSLASGMALKKLSPIVIIYSTFLQRAYDQLIHDFARLKLGLTLLIDRAQVSGADGNSHHGIFDVSLLKTVPFTIISAPCDIYQAKLLLNDSIYHSKNVIYAIRYPKKLPETQYSQQQKTELENNIKNKNWQMVIRNQNKTKKLVITYGNWVNVFKKTIGDNNYQVDLINALFVHGYNARQLEAIINDYDEILVYEEIYGPQGLYSDLKTAAKPGKIIIGKHFTNFPGSGNNNDIYDANGLNVKKCLEEFLKVKS